MCVFANTHKHRVCWYEMEGNFLLSRKILLKTNYCIIFPDNA